MGAILAIVAYELHTTTVQGHQDSVNSSPKGESNTPEMNANSIPWTSPIEPHVGFCSTLHNEFEDHSIDRLQDKVTELKDYSVRLRDGVKIIIERNIKTQTPDIFLKSKVPSLTEGDLSEDENMDKKRKIYQEQIFNVLKESMYDLFCK